MKKLEEMTLEELWRLFPVCLCAYKPEYPVWFEEEKAAVTALAGAQNIFRISHIGSTSVPGFAGKAYGGYFRGDGLAEAGPN